MGLQRSSRQGPASADASYLVLATTLSAQLDELEAELTQDVMDIDTRWNALSKNITTADIPLEKSDVRVTQLCLAWIPVTSTT